MKDENKTKAQLIAEIEEMRQRMADLEGAKNKWKQTEQALAEANVIINRSPAVAFLWRNEEGWPVEFVSENVENLFGYSQEDFVERKMSYLDIIHSEDQGWVLEQVARDSRKTGLKKFAHDPYRIIAKSGEIKWITDRSYVRRDLQGIITHFEGIVYDTTERKQVEKRLEIQRQRLENILQGTNAGTWDWNIGTGEVILNERWAEIIGRTLEELTPATIQIWNDNVHPEDLSDANVLLEKHFNGELDYYDVIFRQPHKNDSWVWVHARGKVVEWDDDGRPLRMSGTHLDITERKLAEEEREYLYVSEQQQRILAETLSEGTLAITSKGDIESILEEILAQSQRLVPFKSGNIMYLEEGEMHLGAWLGYGFEKLEDFFFNSGENFFPVELESIRTGIPAIIPDVSLEPDWVMVEETAWIKSWMGVPIYLQDEVLGILRLDSDEIDKFSPEDVKRLQPLLNAAAVAIDKARLVRRVTEENAERKLAEEKISLLNQELEQRVLERTAELSATIDEIESFSYSVSHDLRAPLRAISGYSEILVDEYNEVLDLEAREYLTNIDQASRKMDDLISGMLALARLSRKNLSLSSFMPGELAIQVYETFKATENDRVIEFQAETECRINADQSLIKILLTNLISNAVKFTREEQSPKIEFGCAKEESRMIFYLCDNGVGFDMTYVDKIFSPFHRLHDEDQFEGTGIGLAIAYRVVQRHKGEIWVESEEGVGTTIYFTIGA